MLEVFFDDKAPCQDECVEEAAGPTFTTEQMT